MSSSVPNEIKKENSADIEIREMAEKIILENRNNKIQKVKFLPSKSSNNSINSNNEISNVIDFNSICGKFGWEVIGNCYIPYIFRKNDKFCPMRIAETKLLNTFLFFLHPNVYSDVWIPAYKITNAEMQLLNEINYRHSDKLFGQELFTLDDYIINVNEIINFYDYLSVCKYKLNNNCKLNDRCGFIRINNESVIPYVIKNNIIFLPLFYFEGDTNHFLNCIYLEGWDLHYLKFCMEIQGIRKELYAKIPRIQVISLDCIKKNFPPNTVYEPFWPKTLNSHLINKNTITSNDRINLHNYWTIKVDSSNYYKYPPSLISINPVNIANLQQTFITNCNNNNNNNTHNNNLVLSSNVSSLITIPHTGKALHQIPAYMTRIGENNVPYRIHQALIEGKCIPCINLKPHMYTEHLMTLYDFAVSFFNGIPINKCKHVLDTLNVKLYRGNALQMHILMQAGKCNSMADYIPLIQLSDIVKYMPQIKYMLIATPNK